MAEDRENRKHDSNGGSLIGMLEEMQSKHGYLPVEELRKLSEETGRSLVDIYGVATFYKAFSLNPRGKHLILACLGTACHVRGAPRIAEEFEHQLGISAGSTTQDMEFTFETVNCLGACALGPTVVVDGHYFSHVTKKRVKEIISRAIGGLDKIDPESDPRVFPLTVTCSVCKSDLLDPGHPIHGHPSIRLDIRFDDTRCWLRLSSLYGIFVTASEREIPENTLSRFYCPHCARELPSYSSCPECGTPMAAMSIRDQCTLEVCTRIGCKGHLLNLYQANTGKTK